MAPVAAALRDRRDRLEHVLATSGQHREMASQMLAAFGIPPDIDLALGEPDQSLAGFASRALEGVAELIDRVRPDVVLVQGDTTTVMAAALAAFYGGVRVGHVEAGLRSFDRANPFPEEVNRRLTAVVADWHFAPTEGARRNLLAEGISDGAIHVTGNTVVDALTTIDLDGVMPAVLDRIATGHRIILVTAHRRESFGPRLRAIFGALRAIVESVRDVEIVYPVHPNPNVAEVAHEMLDGMARVHLVAPLEYRELLVTLQRSVLVLTDSGGIQEEAPSFGVPVLVLREETERPELIEAGAGMLVGTTRERIIEEALRLLGDERARREMSEAKNPFGDGRAAARIADILERSLHGSAEPQLGNFPDLPHRHRSIP